MLISFNSPQTRTKRCCKQCRSRWDDPCGPSQLETLFAFFYFVTSLFAILFSIFVFATSLKILTNTFNFIDRRVHATSNYFCWPFQGGSSVAVLRLYIGCLWCCILALFVHHFFCRYLDEPVVYESGLSSVTSFIFFIPLSQDSGGILWFQVGRPSVVRPPVRPYFHVRTITSKYSRLSVSPTRISRITAYLEVKIWSLF